MKTVLRGRFIALSTYHKKTEKARKMAQWIRKLVDLIEFSPQYLHDDA